jgi:arylsulfatase
MAGNLEIEIDGVSAGSVQVPLYMRMISSLGPSVGYDHGSAVSTRYAAPYEYTGDLHEVVLESSRAKPDVASAEAKAEMNRQ